MSVSYPETDNRKAFRCNVPESQQEAVLCVGRRRLAVRLQNESAGGFALWCERDPRLEPDDKARFFTSFGKFEVRVAHVAEVEPDLPGEGLEGDLASSTPQGGFRIGLELLREMDPKFRPPGEGGGPLGVRALISSGFTLGVLMTLLIVALIVGGVTALTWLSSPAAAQFSLFQSSADANVSTGQLRLRAVARTLELSDVQRDHLFTVAESAAATLKQLDELWQNDPPAERARKQRLLIEATRCEIMGMLTEDQQRRWEAMFEW
jgi:hypothetical protein